nr:ABC transporter ATP-binding protein [Angustibacter aerolatus]
MLLLDEPTTFLDVAHQIEVLDLLADLNRRRGTTVVVVLHDLNLAARYADHLVALKHGRLVAQGDPREVVTDALVQDVFGMRCQVVTDPVSGTPMVVPVGRHHAGRATEARRPGRPGRGAGVSTVAEPRTSPLLAFDVEVVGLRTLTPHLRRITFAADSLADLDAAGPEGPRDLRVACCSPRPATRCPSWATSRTAGTSSGWRSTTPTAAGCAPTRSGRPASTRRPAAPAHRRSTSTSCCTTTARASPARRPGGWRRRGWVTT